MSTTADHAHFSISPRRLERSKASSSWPRRRSWSMPAAEEPSTNGPQIAVVFDVVASTRVGRMLRRRFTEVCRRSRRRHRPPRPLCKMYGSTSASSTFLRRVQSAAASTRPQQSSVFTADTQPPLGVVSSMTQSSWSWTATQPTTRLMTETAAGSLKPAKSTVTRTGSLRDQFVSFFQVSDNKLAMKLFGNKNALEKEKLRHEAVGHWIIHPCSDFRSSLHSLTRSYFIHKKGRPQYSTYIRQGQQSLNPLKGRGVSLLHFAIQV